MQVKEVINKILVCPCLSYQLLIDLLNMLEISFLMVIIVSLLYSHSLSIFKHFHDISAKGTTTI